MLDQPPTGKPAAKRRPCSFEALPPELGMPDATVEQIMRYTSASSRTVQRKIANGTYKSYKNGEKRLILWESVLAERDRLIALGPQLQPPPALPAKRKPGRPRKHPETKTQAAAEKPQDPPSTGPQLNSFGDPETETTADR
jgi:hypothetical protein